MCTAFVIVSAMAILLPATGNPEDNANENLYRELLNAADQGGISLFTHLNEQARQLGWDRANQTHFTGNLRIIKIVKEFTLFFKETHGIILGELLQFGLMPFLAMCLGHLLGFYEQYPFIFVGMISIFLYKPLLPIKTGVNHDRGPVF